MSEEYNYDDVDTSNTSTDIIGRIAVQCSEAERISRRAQALIEELDSLHAQFDHITKKVAPELLREAGLKSYETLDGLLVELKEVTTGSCPAPSTTDPEAQKRRVRIFRWLEEKGYGKLITREYRIHFDRDEKSAALAKEVSEYLKSKKVHASNQFAVNYQTFNKFIRDALAEGIELPEDFKVHRQEIVTLPGDLKVKWPKND